MTAADGRSVPGEMTHRRVHRASPEVLFDCLTDPAHLQHFWGPAGTRSPREGIVVDLRPGGRFETAMVGPDGTTFTMRAVYVEVVRPDRLVWDEAGGVRTTLTFVPLGDGLTEVVTHQSNLPAAFLTPEATAGFATSLDRFDAYVIERWRA